MFLSIRYFRVFLASSQLVISTAGLLASAFASSAWAQQHVEPSHELWVGAHVAGDTWFAYTGGTTAPFGNLNENGFLLRAVGGHGEYHFRGRQRAATGELQPLKFEDSVTFTDALAGYRFQLGSLTATAFVGLAFVDHNVSSPPGFDAAVTGAAWGPKAQVELWYETGGMSWVALNASYTTAHDTYSVGTRSGLRLGTSGFSVGTELHIDNRTAAGLDLTGAYARGGGFIRYAWDLGEISVSGGVAVDLDDSTGVLIDDPQSTYVGVSLLTKF